MLNDVNDWHLRWILLDAQTILFANDRPQLLDIEGRAEFVISVQVEVTHADLSEVTGMVFVEVDAMMVHATSVTATSGMLTVFA